MPAKGKTGTRWKSSEEFDCAQCMNQEHRRCSLPEFSERRWREGWHEPMHMGRLPIVGQDNVRRFMKDEGGDPAAPPEPNDEGCPGGWYRSGFSMSVLPYERTIMDGSIASNPLLDRCDDPLVLAAEQYLEAQRLRHRNYWNDKISGS